MDESEHLDPTGEISTEVVKKRALKGVMVLTGRTFILNIMAFVAQGFLWAYLDEYQFGVFWIVSALVNFLAYFSDVGLAAALIQKKSAVSESDLKTTFLVQQILVVTLLILLFTLSPFLAEKYSLSWEGRMLLYALGISFFMSSLKTIPSVLLERKLEFAKFAIPQVIETFVYNIVVVFCAFQGLGVMSFTYAVLARGITGLIAVYYLQPWKPGFAFSKNSLRGLLNFGVPYQANSLLATMKDDGMTILLGGILGPAGVGILGTAQRLSQYPLRFFMDNVTRVTFPAFARMQDDKKELSASVTRSLFFICFLVFPSLVGLITVAPILVTVIPKYAKWSPALLPLMIVSINIAFAAVTTPLTNLLSAIGKITINFKLMIMWTLLTFLFVPMLSTKYGVIGAATGYALVGVSSIVAIWIARRLVNFSLIESAGKPLLSAIIMGIVVNIVRNILPNSYFSLVILIVLGVITYGVSIYMLVGAILINDVNKSLKALFSK